MNCLTVMDAVILFVAMSASFTFFGFQIGRTFGPRPRKKHAFSEWRTNAGLSCPVDNDEIVIVEFHNGQRQVGCARTFEWGDFESQWDIVRYKIVYGE